MGSGEFWGLTASPTDLLVWAVVIHLVADWPLQTEWMACHKSDLRHPAAWVHSGIHTGLLLLLFAWPMALGIGLSHLLIDTRRPVTWWMNRVKRIGPTAPSYANVELWMNQVFHIMVLAAAVLLIAILS